MPAFYATDGIALHRVSTTDGSYRGRIAFPATGDNAWTVISQSANATVRASSVKRSVDGNSLTLTATNVAAGQSSAPARNKWGSLRVNPDGTDTSVPWGAGFTQSIGQEPVGSVTVDGSRYGCRKAAS